MNETNEWNQKINSRVLKQHARSVLTIDDSFVEQWADAAIKRGAVDGEEAGHLRLIVWKLLENLEQTLHLGERFTLDALGAGMQNTVPYYVEKTPHGLVITVDEIPCEE